MRLPILFTRNAPGEMSPLDTGSVTNTFCTSLYDNLYPIAVYVLYAAICVLHTFHKLLREKRDSIFFFPHIMLAMRVKS